MNDLIVAHVKRHVARITKYIAGLCFGKTGDRITGISLARPLKLYTKVSIYTHYKARTVAAVCKTRTAVYIGITHKLHGIIDNLLSEFG